LATTTNATIEINNIFTISCPPNPTEINNSHSPKSSLLFESSKLGLFFIFSATALLVCSPTLSPKLVHLNTISNSLYSPGSINSPSNLSVIAIPSFNCQYSALSSS